MLSRARTLIPTLIALAGLTPFAAAQYIPAMPMQPMPPGDFGGDGPEDGPPDMEEMMMNRGMMQPGGEEQLQFKTDLGKKIRTLDFTRTPQTVLAARAKLAAQVREAILNPPKPEETKPADLKPDAKPEIKPDVKPDDKPGAATSDAPADVPTSPDELRAAMMARMNGEGGDDAAPGKPLTAEQKKAKAAAMAAMNKKADHFRLLVVAGDWVNVGDFIKKEGGEDAANIYTAVLTGLQQRDQAMVPDEVLALSEACPVEITDKHVTTLGQLLAATQRRGSQAGAVAVAISRGTTHFGGTDTVKRKRAASLLVAAGLPVEAQVYLPPLSQAREAKDAELLNLYAVYFEALGKSKQGKEREAAINQGWEVCLEVLKIENAKSEQRVKALDKAIGFIADMPPETGDSFLASLFHGDADVAWSAIDTVSKKAKMLRQSMRQPPDRVKGLMDVRRVGLAILAGTGDNGRAFRTGLDMLTLTLLEEAEDTRTRRMNERMQFIPPEMLAPALPDARWLTAIDPGLASKLELMVAATAGGSGDTAAVLEMIRPIADTDHERAIKLGEALIQAWPNYVKPRSNNYGEDMYGGGYGGYGGYSPFMSSRYYNRYNSYGNNGVPDGATPLTRAKQQRNLEKLGQAIADLKGLKVAPLPAAAVVEAFSASHSDAEVYQLADIEKMFGAIDAIDNETRLKLGDSMRQKLGTMWRNPRIQQEAGTKRTDKELVAEVVRGYGVGLALASAALEKEPESWAAATLVGDLNYDESEFLYGQKADLATYSGLREAAFAAYDRASFLYARALNAGVTKPSAKVYVQWFSSALGASDLGFLTRQDTPDLDQVAKVKAAIDALPNNGGDKHIGLFAQDILKSMQQMNPELKARFLRHAIRVIGDHKDGKDARAKLAYFEDLIKEVQLTVTPDAGGQAPRGQPFGAQLAVWCTRATSRETGTFAKYLQNGQYNPTTGQPIDYKDDLEKKIRTALADKFEVVSVTFHKPTVQPMGLPRQGWEQFPLAYLLLKAKDPSVDRIPSIQMDMDFSDGQGLVILPIISQVALIDANAAAAPASELKDLTIDQVFDDRKLAADGKAQLEVHAQGKGLMPALDAFLDVSKIAGFKARVDDHGLNVADLDTSGADVLPVSERAWTIELTPETGVDTFTFPTTKVAGVKTTIKKYTDADLVDAQATLSIVPIKGARPWLIGGGVPAVLLMLIGMVIAARKRKAKSAPAGPRFTVPANVTPMSALTTLKKIHAANGEVLGDREQADLLATIQGLERRFFAPDGGAAVPDDLKTVVQTWVVRATK